MMRLIGVEYVPLVSSQRVISALVDGDIDYGVIAVWNSIGGIVGKTDDAIRDVNFEVACETTLDIHPVRNGWRADGSIRTEQSSVVTLLASATVRCWSRRTSRILLTTAPSS